jgi:hypothetical protein
MKVYDEGGYDSDRECERECERERERNRDYYEIVEETQKNFVIDVSISCNASGPTLVDEIHQILKQKQHLERTVFLIGGFRLEDEVRFFTGDSVDCEHLVVISREDLLKLRGGWDPERRGQNDNCNDIDALFDTDDLEPSFFDSLHSLTIYQEDNGMESAGLFTELGEDDKRDSMGYYTWKNLRALYCYTEINQNYYVSLEELDSPIWFPPGLREMRYMITGTRGSIDKLVSALPVNLNLLHLVVIRESDTESDTESEMTEYIHSVMPDTFTLKLEYTLGE